MKLHACTDLMPLWEQVSMRRLIGRARSMGRPFHHDTKLRAFMRTVTAQRLARTLKPVSEEPLM